MTELYVAYCVLDSDGAITEEIAGLHACAVRNLPYGGIGVVTSASTRPIDDLVTGAVEHERVVERLMQMHTVLPMRFPTIFDSRQAALAMMERHYSGFRDDLQRLHNQEEFGVRVIWPADLDFGFQISDRGFVSREESAIRLGDSSSPEAPGKLYMQERHRRHKHHQMLSEQAAQFGRKLDAALSEFASEKHLRSLATDRFVFDGVYLVNKNRQVGFRRAFVDAKSSEPGFRYLFSGPWPPYNFVTMPAEQTTGSARRVVAVAAAECLGSVGGAAGT